MVDRTPHPNMSSTDDLQPLRSHEHAAIERVHLLHAQLLAAVEHAGTSDLLELRAIDFMSQHSPYMHQLSEFYRENLALARLLDTSDLMIHAEGPAAVTNRPLLNAVNWLCGTVEKNVKGMVVALLPMTVHVNKIAARNLDLRLTGIASGSLYAGFCLEATHTNSKQISLDAEADLLALDWLRSSMHALPIVPQFVQADKLDSQIVEALPDPALRDAAILAAFELAPTGQRDIHTIHISAPLSGDVDARSPRPLGQRERVVLRHALTREPAMLRAKKGSFVGLLRAIDLDTGRVIIRNISDELPALRGVLPDGADVAKAFLDRQVRVTGEFDSDATGRPRLMRIDSVESVQSEL